MSNDYYDHHSLQPIPSSGTLAYYQSDAVDCFYDHHKADYPPSAAYTYHPLQQPSTFTYGSSLYEPHPNQLFGQESNLLLLQNQPRLPPVYELSPPQTLSSSQLQAAVLSGTNLFKRESQDPVSTETTEKNQVYEWMKGTYNKDRRLTGPRGTLIFPFQEIKFDESIVKCTRVLKHSS